VTFRFGGFLAIRKWNVLVLVCRVGRRSFWCRFYVNRSTFHEDVRNKRFVNFRSLRLWPFDLKSAVPVTRVRGHVSVKFEVFTTFRVQVNSRHGSDRRAEGRTKWNASCGLLWRQPREETVHGHGNVSINSGSESNLSIGWLCLSFKLKLSVALSLAYSLHARFQFQYDILLYSFSVLLVYSLFCWREKWPGRM